MITLDENGQESLVDSRKESGVDSQRGLEQEQGDSQQGLGNGWEQSDVDHQQEVCWKVMLC